MLSDYVYKNVRRTELCFRHAMISLDDVRTRFEQIFKQKLLLQHINDNAA